MPSTPTSKKKQRQQQQRKSTPWKTLVQMAHFMIFFQNDVKQIYWTVYCKWVICRVVNLISRKLFLKLVWSFFLVLWGLTLVHSPQSSSSGILLTRFPSLFILNILSISLFWQWTLYPFWNVWYLKIIIMHLIFDYALLITPSKLLKLSSQFSYLIFVWILFAKVHL